MRPERYDGIAILFHWLIATLIVINIGLAWSLDNFDHHSPEHDRILTVHKSIGATILLLAVLRLAWRWTHPTPALPETCHAGSASPREPIRRCSTPCCSSCRCPA